MGTVAPRVGAMSANGSDRSGGAAGAVSAARRTFTMPEPEALSGVPGWLAVLMRAWRTCQPSDAATDSASGTGNSPSRRPARAMRCSMPTSASRCSCQPGPEPTTPANRRTRLARPDSWAFTRRAARSDRKSTRLNSSHRT